MNMSISDALLCDAQWWFGESTLENYSFYDVDKIRAEWGGNLTYHSMWSTRAEMFFCLLIREAIKDE